MAFTKYASLESAEVLELRSSRTKVRHASLGKLADFNQYRTEDGYLYARIRAISSRVNKNFDGWPSIELAGGPEAFEQHHSSTDGFTIAADHRAEYGFSTFTGKPIFVDHHNSDPNRARGVIVDSLLHVEDHKTSGADAYYSSSEVDPEHLPGTWIELLLEVDAKAFPKFAKAIVEGSRNPHKGIDGWSMGCDVEKSVCSICKNAASQPDDYCTHVKLKGAYFDTVDPRTGHKTSKRAYENCYGVKFFEISGVFDPADETALSREVRSKTQEETITQDPKEEGLKDLADDLNEELLDESGKQHLKVKKRQSALPCPNCEGHSGTDCPMCNGHGHLAAVEDGSDPSGGLGDPGQWTCPSCGHDKYLPKQVYAQGDTPASRSKLCLGCGAEDRSPAMGGDGSSYAPLTPATVNLPTSDPGALGPVHEGGLLDNWRQPVDPDLCGECNGHGTVPSIVGESICHSCEGTGRANYKPQAPKAEERSPYDPRMVTASTHTAENPLPQSEMAHGPEPVDTLRAEEICPVCGSSMDDDTCTVCGYEEPPEGFGNPDLTKVQDVDVPDTPGPGMDDRSPEPPEGPREPAEQAAVNTPSNPTALAHVTSDMDWDVHSKTSARINKVERPLLNSDKPQTNEPVEKILSDQARPVTSRVRTARDFIAAAGATRGQPMNHTAEAASGAPAVAKPDVHTDVTGIGGVDQASNDAASKADAQVDVTGIGGVGVESVGAEQEGVNVEQGDEHSKNIEAIPTKTWTGDQGDSLGQHAPVTSEPFPASEDGVRASSWTVESYDDAPFPNDEIEGGSAVRGVRPIAESFGDRVDVLDHVTSPANNSGPTTTWTGTDGNGVNKQQDPVTPESIALGQSGMEDAPNWTSSTHIFSAFKLADLEIELGLIPADARYDRAAQLERESPTVIAATLQYAQRMKKAGVHRTAGAKKLPVMARSTTVEKEASVAPTPSEDDSFMFGG